MSDYSKLIIQPLESHHDRAGFHSGAPSLDTYIQKQAHQDVKRRSSSSMGLCCDQVKIVAVQLIALQNMVVQQLHCHRHWANTEYIGSPLQSII